MPEDDQQHQQPEEHKHPKENLSPDRLNSPRQRRKITKEGPPSRAELEERKRMLEDYKRAREEKRREEMASRMGLSRACPVELDMHSDSGKDEAMVEPKSVPMCPPIIVIDSDAEALTIEAGEARAKEESDDARHINADEEVSIPGTGVSISNEEPAALKCNREDAPIILDNLQCNRQDGSTRVGSQSANEDDLLAGATHFVDEEVSIPTVKLVEASCDHQIPAWKANDMFWFTDKVYLRYPRGSEAITEAIRVPHQRFFRLKQVETQLACGNFELAQAMLSVITAAHQLPYNDVEKRAPKRIEALRRRFISSASEFLEDVSMTPPPEPSIELPPPPKPGHFSGSDSEQDETGSKLQLDVEEASRRHSIILSDLQPRTPKSTAIHRAARMIMDDEDGQLMDSVRKRLCFDAPATEQCKRQKTILVSDDENDEAGSTVKYALLTPSKRIKEMLQTDVVVSPVRRSFRNLASEEEEGGKTPTKTTTQLFDQIEQVDMAEVGYLPNLSVSGSPFKKKTPSRKEQ